MWCTTISLSSSLASSTPATSAKLTVCCKLLPLLWRLPGPRLGSLMGSRFIAPRIMPIATTYICTESCREVSWVPSPWQHTLTDYASLSTLIGKHHQHADRSRALRPAVIACSCTQDQQAAKYPWPTLSRSTTASCHPTSCR